MARQDIANMLTGMGGGSTRPNPNMSSSDWRMAFGAQQAQGLMNAARTTTPQEAIQMGIGKLDLGTVKGLQTLGQMQQIRGDLKGTAQTAAAIEALKAKQKLPDQAEAVAANLPASYAGLAKAIRAGVPGALEQGVKIMGTIPAPVKDPALVAEWRVAVEENDYKGDLADWAELKKARGINLAQDPVAKARAETLERNLGSQALMYEKTREEQDIARQEITTGESILNSVSKEGITGTFGESTLQIASAFQGIYEIAGVTPPEGISSLVQKAGSITKAGYEAMLPLIEAQGRGFTDKDREAAVKVLPGLQQSWQYNEFAGNLSILKGLKSQEKNQFARQRSLLDEITATGGETLWTHYLNDLPMSESKQVTNRGLTYERLQPIRDNENLSQYWVTERPKGFKIKSGSNVVEMTMKDIRDTAAKKYGMTPRAYLADLSNQGLLIDGVYE